MDEMAENVGRLVGVEVKNSVFSAVSLSLDGEIVDSFHSSTEPGGETALHLGNFVTKLKAKFGEFEKIGMAVPGLINRKTMRVAYSTNIPKHAEIDLLSELAKATGVKIQIENDANAAAYGEFHLGAGRDSKDMFYVMLGEGVGGAFLFDGKLWHGGSGFAGEFGYVAINSEGMRLEKVASMGSILRRTRDRFHNDPTSSLNKIGEDNITIADVIHGATGDDGFSELMLERTGFYIGTAVASVINLLNIEKIVIGGEILNAKDIVLDAIKNRAKELSFAPGFETVEIVRGELGGNVAAIGAALLSRDKN